MSLDETEVVATPRVLGQQRYPDVTQDAVVVIPGIMGSALVDTATETTVWGLNHLSWYRQAWTSGTSLRALATREPDRIRATGLLKFPAWAPLTGFEPYTALVRSIRAMVAHHDALLEFAYDWRLPVLHNARHLAHAARRHLDTWRTHPVHDQAREVQPDQRPARLVLVAHSMGGLLARALPLVEGDEDAPIVTADVRATITLGTPFEGAAKAAVTLGTGRGVPLPKRRLAQLVRALPGMYDLLPTYRCVDTRDNVRHLSIADVTALGGDSSEVERAFAFHRRISEVELVGHRALIGVEQPTVSLLRIDRGNIDGLDYTFNVNSDGTLVRDRHGIPVRMPSMGDGTVPNQSAALPRGSVEPLAQQHGALGHVQETITFVRWILLGQRPGGRLAPGECIGIETPDLVTPVEEWPIIVSGVDGPNDATCQIIDAETGELIDEPVLHWRDNRWQFIAGLPMEHLYRVVVKGGGGGTPVSRMVLATQSDLDNDE